MRFLLVLLLVILVSCESKKDKNYFLFNNFDHLDGWGGINSNSLSKKQSVSKPYSLKIDKNESYSLGYSKEMSKIFGGAIPSKMYLGTQIFRNSENSKGYIVMEVRNNVTNEMEFYKTYKIDSLVSKTQEWQAIKVEFQFPKIIQMHSVFKFYLMQESGQDESFIDDFYLDIVH
jgi:hypothetical protein